MSSRVDHKLTSAGSTAATISRTRLCVGSRLLGLQSLELLLGDALSARHDSQVDTDSHARLDVFSLLARKAPFLNVLLLEPLLLFEEAHLLDEHAKREHDNLEISN